MKINWNFLRGEGVAKQKNLQWGEYGYFLELHNAQWVQLELTDA